MKGTENNKHFSPEAWVDFANGTVANEQRLSMEQHLQEGCKPCRNAAALWTRVQDHARREAGYQAPASAIRHVKSAFALLAQERKAKPCFIIPNLVFDSFWQPALAGVRSTTAAPRQVLYKVGDVSVEMRLEPEPLSERMNITGQVYRSCGAGEGLAQIPVLVTGKAGSLAEAHTNEFGEFQLSFVPQDRLRVVFAVERGQDLSIPLDARGVAIFSRG